MKYHIVWITTTGRTFCKMFDKSLYDYYDSFTNAEMVRDLLILEAFLNTGIHHIG